MDTAPETTTAEPIHEHSAAYDRYIAATHATKAAARRAREACGPDTAAQEAVAALRDVAWTEDRAWGHYLEERAYQQALDQLDGLDHYVHTAIGAAYNAALLLRDMQRQAGRTDETRRKVSWANPLDRALHRLSWVRDRCVPKDTTSRTQMGEELDAAIAQLQAVTNIHAWTQPHKD